MGITNLAVFNMLRTKMHWHETRQSVLAENIANADTPNFRANDLKDLDFNDPNSFRPPLGVGTVQTHGTHIAPMPIGGGVPPFSSHQASSFEITPSGNSVVLEDEMMKMTSNQLDYETVSTLYQRSLAMLKIAIGKNA